FFLDRYIGFLGGGIRNFGGIERPVIFKTTDGGENWERLIRFPVGFGFGQSDRIKEIQFFNSRKGIVLTTRGLFQTDDGGSNWTNISERLPNNSGGILMEFVNNTTGFIFDEQGKLFKTYNQGNSWFEVNSINAPNSEISCISASSFEKLYACAENGYWKSEDNGHIWILNSSNQAKFDAIAFKDDELGFAAISSSSGNVSLFRTQNGGVQWVPEQIPTPINEVVEMTYLQSLKRVVAISRDGTVIGLED
ncbi:MAG: YCF48-related protein, partial [Bacteroidota bacterium]